MSASAKVPVTIVTGFLGAGKTTLIRHVLENVRDRRLALIVNEFGDVGVDGDILRGCGVESCPDENIVELANGCLCCTVADDFVPTMEALLARTPRPDHILVETSGLALPKPLVKAFEWPVIRSHLTVDGVIAVVDGLAVAEGRFADDPVAVEAQRAADGSVDHDNPLEEVFEDQVLCADLVVLNKADLLDADTIARVRSAIAAASSRPRIVEARHGRLDRSVLLGLGAGAEDDLANRPSHHDSEDEHDHEDFESFVVPLPELASAEGLLPKLAAIAAHHDILRIKGFLAVRGKAMRLLVQGVGPRFSQNYEPAGRSAVREGRLVVIGEKGLDRNAIERALAGLSRDASAPAAA